MLNAPEGNGFFGAQGFNGDIIVAQNHGFRAFRFTPSAELLSLVYDYPWTPGVNRSVCAIGTAWNKPGRQCPFPNKRCSHGFYAYYGEDYYPSHVDPSDGLAINGVINGYGRCVIGDKGYRSEYADIVALIRPHGSPLAVSRACFELERKFPTVPIFDSALELKAAIPLPGRPPRNTADDDD